MAWTQAEIDALEDAKKLGAKRVKYEDREVEYQSMREVSRVLEEAKRALGTAKRGRRFTFSSSSKGIG